MNLTKRQVDLLLQVVRDGRLEYHSRTAEGDKNNRQALRALRVLRLLETRTGHSLYFVPTVKGQLVAKAAALGLFTETQADLLQRALKDGGTWTGGGGPAAMARRLKEAGLLVSPDDFAYQTTDKGRDALAAWKEVFA